MVGCGLYIMCFRWDAAKCVASWVPDTDDLVEKARKIYIYDTYFWGEYMHVFWAYVCFWIFLEMYTQVQGSNLQRGVSM